MNNLIFILSLTKPLNMPIPIINYLKINTKMGSTSLREENIGWEKINNYDKILNKYFDNYKNKYENTYTEIFKIYGVPAAAIIIEFNIKKKHCN